MLTVTVTPQIVCLKMMSPRAVARRRVLLTLFLSIVACEAAKITLMQLLQISGARYSCSAPVRCGFIHVTCVFSKSDV